MTVGTLIAASKLRVERVVTSGVFTLDGDTWEVENNIYLIGDDTIIGTESPHLADWIARGN